jgi:5-methylcytosine-specific restriction endonuclease McrA
MPDNYLDSDRWRALRARALHRANYRCQLCNGQRSLEAHHRTYVRYGYELVDDVTVLCAVCHRRHHGTTRSDARINDTQLKLPL